MPLRRRWLALAALALHGAATIALPILHQRGHKNDHVHVAGGIVLLDAFSDENELPGVAHHHQAFDADLAALGLSEAGHFGIADVDCSLADYTLVACDDPGAPAHSFGDELLARQPHSHRHRAPFDPAHGAGSQLHFGLALLAPSPVILPPPSLPVEYHANFAIDERAGSSPALSLHARGPPALLS
jgi:hypothetical protein